MENNFDNITQINDHLLIAQAGSSLNSWRSDEYGVAIGGTTRRNLSLIDCNIIEDINVQKRSKYEFLSDQPFNDRMCKMISIDSLRLNRDVKEANSVSEFLGLDVTPDILGVDVKSVDENTKADVDNLNMQINEIFNIEQEVESRELETTKTFELVDQLRVLNPNARIFVKSDESGSNIISSVYIHELNLPLDYKYDRKGHLVIDTDNSSETYQIEVKKTSAVDVFHGEDKDSSCLIYSNLVDQSSTRDLVFKAAEIPKTEEQKKQINNIIEGINVRRRNIGLEDLYFDDRSIHYIDREVMQRECPSELGFYYPQEQAVYVCSQMEKRSLLFILSHELKHPSSFNSMKKKNGHFDSVRLGFRLFKDGKQYFKLVDEAIFHEESLKLDEYMVENDPMYADDADDIKKIINEQLDSSNKLKHKRIRDKKNKKPINIYEELCALLDDKDKNNKDKDIARFVASNYSMERETLGRLTKRLGKYSGMTKEKVYDMFLIGAEKGNYLPVARLMDANLGKGSFRRFGEESMTTEGFVEFVDRVPAMRVKENINKIKRNVEKAKEDVKKFVNDTLKKVFSGFKKRNLFN